MYNFDFEMIAVCFVRTNSMRKHQFMTEASNSLIWPACLKKLRLMWSLGISEPILTKINQVPVVTILEL